MTQSRNLLSQFNYPRIVNLLAIALALCVLYTMSLQKNTAQEPAVPGPVVQATDLPVDASVAAPADAPEDDATKSQSGPVPTTPTNEAPKQSEVNQAGPNPAIKIEEPLPELQLDEPKLDGPKPDGEGETFSIVEAGTDKSQGFEDVTTPTAKETDKETAEKIAAVNAEKWKNFYDRMMVWGVFLVILIGSFTAGNYLAKLWRLPEHHIRIFVLLLAFFGSLAAVYLGWNRMTLGIDLQGGVVLVYDAKPLVRSGEEGQVGADGILTADMMDKLTSAISQRINPDGMREISITKLGSQQLQVIIPKAEDAEVDRIQRIISESGALTFRILASTLYDQDKDIIDRAKREPGGEIRGGDGRLIARWVPIYEGEASQFRNNPDIITRENRKKLEVLVLYNDGVEITGEYLSNVYRGMDDQAQPGVSFQFNATGAMKFKRLTTANQPDKVQSRLRRQLGIILNESLYSAPAINAVISDSGIITFGRRQSAEGRKELERDIEDLIAILNAGALPAELSKEPVSRMLIGATLGADTIQKGKVALTASAAIVLVFMLCYYRLAGIIACFCVVTNLMMLVAIMLALRAAFTLPGLAGLVLTIGMAVDANILIYERLREELQTGSSLKMAIRNAYAKALSAIVDSNITTIITGIILYAVGTEQVKGFAVTLVLGVSLSMFTAIYCARTIMDIFEAQKAISTFRMLQLFNRPNINFLGARVQLAIISIVLILVGIAGVTIRGSSIFDIDFVGGVSVEADFKDSQEITSIRARLYAQDAKIEDVGRRLNDLAVQNVQASSLGGGSVSELTQAKPIENTRFIITTSIPQVDPEIKPDQYLITVRNILKETFGDDLMYCQFDYTFKDSSKPDEVDAELKCFPKINHESLKSLIDAAIQKAVREKILENDFSYSLTTEGYVDGSQNSFTDWQINASTSREIMDKAFSPLKVEQDGTPYFPSSTTVGGSVARDTRTAGFLAIVGSLVCIILYVWFRFHGFMYGLVSVIGLVHDVLIVLGMIALSAWLATPLAFLQVTEFKIGLPVVAAFLTIIGYSLNDTIILFDRIRENRGKSPVLTGSMINRAINQTLSRTVLTSLTTFFVAIILYFWGGQGIHTFAFAMSAGVFWGTYSTIGVCAPLLFWLCAVDDTQKKDGGSV